MAFAVAARYSPRSFSFELQTATPMARDKFYITTPIFYPNGKPHIGHAYKVIATDALARFQRLDGKDVFFLTGTDEHGLKMQQTAEQEGITRAGARRPQFGDLPLDGRSARRLQRRLHPHHRAAPLQGLPGDLGGDGRQWRHLSRPLQRLVFGPRRKPISTRAKPRSATTACAASRWARRSNGTRRRATSSGCPPTRTGCWRSTKANPDFVGPAERRNEVMSFVKSGLKDLSISRTTFDWGVPVPGDDKHVMYVWVDALTNYITARRLSRHQGRELALLAGRRTSSARTSCASTPSTGRPS